jgi:transposase
MRSHTVVAVDGGSGRQLAERTVAADEDGCPGAVGVRPGLDGEREWAIEDCRNLSRHLESAAGGGRADPQGAAQADVRGSQLGAHVGKSDVIDALAVARAALREPDLRVAQLAGPEREIAPLLDHRANLVVERTRT